MAMQLAAPLLTRDSSRRRIGPKSFLFKFLALASLNFFCSNLAQAQLPQPLVFSSGGAVLLRNDQTGLLTPTNGSPFPPAGQLLTIDVQGRFLFSPGVNSIHMFQITDATTGAYQEVPHSPFASPNTNSPAFIAVEPTGQFIAVVDTVGRAPGASLVESFKIDTSNPGFPALVPVPGSPVELVSTPLPGGFAQPPGAQKFFLYMGPNPFSSDPILRTGEDFEIVTIDPLSGNLLGIQNQPNSSTGRCFAMDPQGRFVVLGHGQLQGRLDLQGVTPSFPSGAFLLPLNLFPEQLFVDSTGTFVYVSYTPDPSNQVHIIAVNPTTSAMTESPGSPLPGATTVPQYFPDPTGPFQYGGGAQPNQLQGFAVDPQTGHFLEIAGSPFTVNGAGSLTFSIPAGQQGVSGPSISLSANSLSFPSQQTNSTSPAQMLTLTSTGAQALSINSIAISGPDSADFTESDTCHPPNVLQPKAFCSASVAFKPLTPGPKQASLTVTDDAPGSPHSVPLTGTAVAPPPPAPAVTIAPNPVNFPTIAQGATSSPINITVTNSGNATLHISTVTIAGNNSADFSNSAGSCSGGTIAANSSCSISVIFTPLAPGHRTETISIVDDAADSPQVINVSGDAIPAPVPAVTLTPNPVNFPTITQGTSGTPISVTVTNSGGATLHVTTVTVAGSNSADFTNPASPCANSAIAPNSSCSISVTFAPLAAGQRSETISLADDASGSPQLITVSGNATPAISVAPAPTGSTSVSVNAGATAQFQLQLTPGANYTGNVTFACTGAPLGAACQAPSLTIANGNAMPFTVTVTTSGLAHAQLFPLSPRGIPASQLRVLPLLFLLPSLLLIARAVSQRTVFPKRCLFATASFLLVIFLVSFHTSGCGGGSAQPVPNIPPPSVITPPGTSVLTVTPNATSFAGKPLQLPPIQLTLTVN